MDGKRNTNVDNDDKDVVLVPNKSTSRPDGKIALVRKMVQIPEHPRARLMFYMHCVNNILDLGPLHSYNLSKLIDYSNFCALSEHDLESLLVLCILFYPGSLTDMCIFMDEDACDHVENDFVEKSADVRKKYAFVDSLILGKNRFMVTHPMIFSVSFLEKNYFEPFHHFDHVLEKLKLTGKQLSGDPVVSKSQCCAIS